MTQEKGHFNGVMASRSYLLSTFQEGKWRPGESNPFWIVQFSMPEILDFKEKATEMNLISSLNFLRKMLKPFPCSIEKAFHGNQIMRVKKEKEIQKKPSIISNSQSQNLH